MIIAVDDVDGGALVRNDNGFQRELFGIVQFPIRASFSAALLAAAIP